MNVMPKGSAKTEYSVKATDTLLPFLLAHVKGKSRNAVKGLLSRRQVLVDGETCTRFDRPLAPGQTVTLLPQGDRLARTPPFPILYEDDALIAVDKPAGLLTVANEREKERTAYRLLSGYLGGETGRKGLFVVHRLDMDTSGVVLFAKSDEMKYTLQEHWDELVRRRVYLAAVEGAPTEPNGTVRSWLKETKSHMVYSAGPDSGGKEAVTRYETIAAGEDLTLLRVELDTGRKNQIRVHMKDLGCPVSGDRKYGLGDKKGPMGRLGLHAWALAFTDPRTGQERFLRAPAPRPFRQAFPAVDWQGLASTM